MRDYRDLLIEDLTERFAFAIAEQTRIGEAYRLLAVTAITAYRDQLLLTARLESTIQRLTDLSRDEP